MDNGKHTTQASPRQISQDDLPLCCPLPNETLWNAHPRVYLPITKTGQATCPYCSAHYVLRSSDS